ncbi:MAG: zf-TFIIB domain-containing protein [Candidatus Omnitrophota bacterium]
MLCPRTGKSMKEIELGGVKVDVSTGCGGVWFDHFEIKKFDEEHESEGEELVKAMEKYADPSVDVKPKVKCPRCEDITLLRRYFSPKRQVTVDECGKCGGFWLDLGELLTIRKQFKTEKERNQAGEKFVNEVFMNNPEVKAMQAKGKEDLKKARRVANVFKYICPSHYIPGDQDWGAF